VLAKMGGRRREGAKRYRAFVESGLAEDDADFQAALKTSPLAVAVWRRGCSASTAG
jgi:hypothetical protein